MGRVSPISQRCNTALGPVSHPMLLVVTRKNSETNCLGRSVWTVQSTRYRDGSYSSPVTLACIMQQILCCIEQEVFCGEFSPPGDRKKGLANPTNGFLRIFLKNSPSRLKKLEVARFRQCVPLCRQN
jgi:hypothetical protein